MGLKSDEITITGGNPLKGRIAVRGAKNLATKAMVASLLGEGPSELRSAARAFNRMRERIRALVEQRTLEGQLGKSLVALDDRKKKGRVRAGAKGKAAA